MGYGRILGDLKESDPRVHGARTEAAARAAYEERMQDHIYVEECGLFILEEHPWLGASPDGLLMCLDSRSQGVLEIKCPASALPVEALARKDGVVRRSVK